MRDNAERINMNNSTTKKQNKVLLVALVIILAAAAILIAVTGGANKKEKENNPPLDNIPEQGSPSSESNKGNEQAPPAQTVKPEKTDSEKTEDVKTPAKNEPKDEKDSEKDDTPSSTESTEDKEVSSVISNTLPKFQSPISNVVIKDYSGDVPVFSYTMADYRTHNGLDFACSPGTPVSAAADGVICEIISDPMMGATVGIQHSGGAITRYCNLSEESLDLKKIGDIVKRGDVIGSAGSTALIESAEEDHIHFELSIEGTNVDPAEYMEVTFLSELYED